MDRMASCRLSKQTAQHQARRFPSRTVTLPGSLPFLRQGKDIFLFVDEAGRYEPRFSRLQFQGFIQLVVLIGNHRLPRFRDSMLPPSCWWRRLSVCLGNSCPHTPSVPPATKEQAEHFCPALPKAEVTMFLNGMVAVCGSSEDDGILASRFGQSGPAGAFLRIFSAVSNPPSG